MKWFSRSQTQTNMFAENSTNWRCRRIRIDLAATTVALGLIIALNWAGPGQRRAAAAAASDQSAAPSPPLQPRELSSNSKPLPTRTIRVIVLDHATGQPLEGANVDVPVIDKPEMKTDAHGRVEFVVHDGLDPIIDVWRTQYINKRVRWEIKSGEPPPTEYTVRLDPVSSIGGKVVDDAGQPIAGANVEIYVNGRMEDEGALYVEWPWINRAVVTAADGTWHFDRIPPDTKSIKVAAWDYHHLGSDYFFLRPYTPVAALRDKTAVLTLPRAVAVEGSVVDPFSGKPIPRATITFGPDQSVSNKIPPITADEQGKFKLGVRPGTKLFLTASAPNCRPEVHEEVAGDKPMSIEFDLSPAHFVVE